MLKELLHKVAPETVVEYLRDIRRRRLQKRVSRLRPLTEDDLRTIILGQLDVRKGDILFVHSSIDKLNLTFPFYRVLALLREAVGEKGTLLFPTYPKLTSYKFLQSGEVFDVRKTPSYTGILTEFARRQRAAVRSLHPTKSVAALGPVAKELTSSHPDSPYPYDSNSPYFKVIERGGKAIGIGVGTVNLSLVHCVDDALKQDFPVWPYHNEIFDAPCLDYLGDRVMVRTYGHDMRKMGFDIPQYMAEHIPDVVCQDIAVDGMRFFRANTAPLFEQMVKLAERGITIYPQRFYS